LRRCGNVVIVQLMFRTSQGGWMRTAHTQIAYRVEA
jgi:hypothetical protein